MKVTAAGKTFEVVESTSPMPGRRSLVFVDDTGRAWPDLFLFDPLSQTVHYDAEEVSQFVMSARVSQVRLASVLLATTDTITALGRGAHRLASGGYGGTFGFGSAGGLIAAAGGLLNLLVQMVAFIVTVPFRLLGGAVRWWLSRSIWAEEQKLVQAMPQVFAALRPSGR